MTDDDVWTAFLEFVGRAPAAQHPGVLFDGYRDDLVVHGVSVEEAARRTAIVMGATRRRHDWAAPMFDRIYTSDAPLFSAAPNAFVVAIAAGLPPGRALDVAMGQGRNAVHLARLGWDVTGFDVSTAGLRAAQDAAAASGVSIRTVHSSSDDFDYGDQSWDLVVLTYALVPVASPDYVATVTAALAPAGCVAIESFATVDGRAQRPVDIDPEGLRAAYGALDEVDYELVDATADWTLDEAPIVRLAARRPVS